MRLLLLLGTVNCVWLKMLYISARNMRSRRLSFPSGNAFANVMSQLNRRVLGIGMMLPGPAFPKQDSDWPVPFCGGGPGVKLHGNGITNALSFRRWLPAGPFAVA